GALGRNRPAPGVVDLRRVDPARSVEHTVADGHHDARDHHRRLLLGSAAPAEAFLARVDPSGARAPRHPSWHPRDDQVIVLPKGRADRRATECAEWFWAPRLGGARDGRDQEGSTRPRPPWSTRF